jgi:hypothetical protein
MDRLLCIDYSLTCDGLPNCAKTNLPNPDENCEAGVRGRQQTAPPSVAVRPEAGAAASHLHPGHRVRGDVCGRQGSLGTTSATCGAQAVLVAACGAQPGGRASCAAGAPM